METQLNMFEQPSVHRRAFETAFARVEATAPATPPASSPRELTVQERQEIKQTQGMMRMDKAIRLLR